MGSIANMNDNKEWLRLVAALDSLYAAGFSKAQVKATADRLGVDWN